MRSGQAQVIRNYVEFGMSPEEAFINVDQRYSARCAAAEANQVTASLQVGRQFFGQVVGDREAAQIGTVLA